MPPLGSLVSPAPDPLTSDARLQGPLDVAVAAAAVRRGVNPATVALRFAIADITTPAGSFPFGGFGADVTDYIASEAKVAVMFSAYALREAIRVAAATPLALIPGNFLSSFAVAAKPVILAMASRIRSAPAPVNDTHRLPIYSAMISATPTVGGVNVAFTSAYDTALEQMIVPSSNEGAAACIHGVGYSFLNGALEIAGFFVDAGARGLWVAGDYLKQGTAGKYPAVRIPAVNDGDTAQGGTARQMARLVALIATGRVLSAGTCTEMMTRLRHAATGPDTPFMSRAGVIPRSRFVANKLGTGPYKNGRDCISEVSVLENVGRPGRRYALAWHNLDFGRPFEFTDVATIVRDTILGYELLVP